MTTPHPLAEYLHAYANGEKVEQRPNKSWPWARVSLMDFADAANAEYRIAPETVLVNGVECPKSIPAPHDETNWIVVLEWGTAYTGRRSDSKLFTFTSQADARTVFDALYKPFKEDV